MFEPLWASGTGFTSVRHVIPVTNKQCQSTIVVVVIECTDEPYVATSSAECNCCSPLSSLVCGQLLTKTSTTAT